MAVVKNLMVRCGADFTPLQTAMKKTGSTFKTAQTQVQTSSTAMASSAKLLRSAFSFVGIGLSFAAITSGIKSCVEAYTLQETAEKKLEVVMRQRMDATDAEIQKIKDLTAAQQKAGIIGDEVQLSGAQQLSTFLKETSSLEKLIPAMNDLLAQQKGVDAAASDAVNIGNLMGKVMQGQTSALKRVGITFDAAQESVLKYGDEEARAATLAQVITDNVGRMNSALAQTKSGRIKQLANTLGDVKE